MNIFKIGDTDFGIGEVVLIIDGEKNAISDLTITADKEVYKKITDNENSKWNWTLYPPKIYLKGIPFQQNTIINVNIDEDLLDEYDIALYFMEHNDLFGTLVVSESLIQIKGEAQISGKLYPLEISAERTK